MLIKLKELKYMNTSMFKNKKMQNNKIIRTGVKWKMMLYAGLILINLGLYTSRIHKES